LYEKFGTRLAGVGNAWQTGNIETVCGETGSIADGLDYNYLYQQPPDHLVDYIEPTAGLIAFKSQDGLARGITYTGVSNTYRTMNTSFIFGALINGIHTKNELMETYMNYLIGNTAVEESEDDVANTLAISVSPNPFSKLTNISFEVDSRLKSVVSIKMYDISGRVVKSLSFLPSALGPMQISWDGTDNSGRRVSSGTYIVRITTDQAPINRAVVLIH
jgi:hypothetical protein